MEPGATVKHVVQYSTGVGSAEVAWRIVEQYGAENVVLLSADTLVEHPDNWRFAREVHGRLGCEWVVLADGRTPMQVGRDKRVVPNNRMAICSRVLKRELLRKHIDESYDPTGTVIYLGFDWTEPDRHAAAVPHWQPYRIESPLIAPPYLAKPDLLETFRRRGIEPPSLYKLGLPHANCGGFCVRGGQAQWALMLQADRHGYLAWESEEETTRALLGKDVAILRDRRGGTVKPLPLAVLRERLDEQTGLVSSPRLRNSSMIDRPSRLGNIRSTTITS
jgi:hypothetical protein